MPNPYEAILSARKAASGLSFSDSPRVTVSRRSLRERDATDARLAAAIIASVAFRSTAARNYPQPKASPNSFSTKRDRD